MGKLHLSSRKSLLDDFLGFGIATAKALLEHLHGRRLDEDQMGIGHLVPDLERPLHIDLEDDLLACRHMLLDASPGRTVMVGPVHRPLEQAVGIDELLELLIGFELVVNAVYLACAGIARGGRNRDPRIGNRLHKSGHQGAFAST